jgi:hypothetical protein
MEEASEITTDEMSPANKRDLDAILAAVGFGGKAGVIWSGGHGFIVEIEGGPERMNIDNLKKLVAIKSVRWIEYNGGFTVAF